MNSMQKRFSTVILGSHDCGRLLDFAAKPQRHPALMAATWHMWIMLNAASAFACSLIVRLGQFSSSGVARIFAIELSALGLGLSLIGGWFGSEMVFGHGVGCRGADGDESQSQNFKLSGVSGQYAWVAAYHRFQGYAGRWARDGENEFELHRN